MKKFTLFLIATLFSAMSFAALNPFAYGLSSTLNADETELTVNYSLNATATSVDFVLLDGETIIKTVNLNDKGLVKGSYTATITLDDPNMPLGKDLTWKIEVKGNSVDKPTIQSETYDLYCPHGLAIDKNPESEHFGRILVTESMQAVASKSADAYVSGGKGAGIYVFNPDFTTDKTRYSGGIDFTRKLASNGYQPYQVEISEDGRIFVSSCDINGVAVWEVSKDLNTWTPVISGTNDATDYTIKKNGNFFAGLNVAMDVKGSGDDLTLLLYSTNNKGIAFNQSGYRLDEYKLGTATTFTGTPKNIINGGALAIVHTDVDFIYDGEGGYWFGASRSNTSGTPAKNLAHFNANGVEDYSSTDGALYGGGGVLVHNGMLFKGKSRSTSANGNFGVYTIGKDANGKTTLTEKWAVASPGLGRNHNAFAVDYAENLYVVGNNGEKMLAYALPYSGTVATPCASKYAITINSDVQMAKASELNPYAYDLSSELSDNKKTLTINYSLNANATAVKAIIMEGDTEVKTVACTGITRGNHTVEIPTTDLPVGPKYTWKIKVDGTSKDKPTQVSTYYSLYCSHGLAIDKNPESEYFGRILAAEGMDAVPATGYLSSGQGGGLYVFNPDFSTDGKVRNGGIDFTRQWANRGYQPWRVKISEDGRIFVSSCDLNGKFVWELSKDLNTWTEVLARGQEKTNARMKGNAFTTGGQFLAGANLSMDVIGSGKDLKLLLYSASGTAIEGESYTRDLFRLDEYALGEATKWDNSKEPKHISFFDGKYGFMYTNVNIIYDGEGGYWFGASRGGGATQPNLVHFDKNGNRDYYSESVDFYGGDGVLVHNGMLIKGKNRKSATVGRFGVYTMSKDASGNIVLTEKWNVEANHIGRNLNEFAVDYGENLYVVGNSGEKIIAFAMPYSGSVTTPCAAKYAFELEAHGVVKRAVQLGESTIVLTHEADGTPYLYNVVGDVMTPISQNGIVVDPENAGEYLAISDIAVTEDGKLVACNYIMCQSAANYVDPGYKRGESRFYIWDNLNANPSMWFSSKMSSNWFRANQGYTMALKGNSNNCQILLSGPHGQNGKARFSVYNVINGQYVEPSVNNNDYYHYHNGASDISGVDMTTVLGANYELNASPWDNMWIMDGNLIEPYEVNVSTTNNVALTNGDVLATTLGKKYNGATYFNINNLCFMLAPYADASGKVAGVKLIDINNGLASAKVVQTLNLVTPVAGTAAATAVKVNGYDLAITLVVDATIYTINTTIELEVIVDENANNSTALAPYEGETVTATVVRNFASNRYYTLTLPFDMTASQLTEFFGDVTVYEFYDVIEASSEMLLQFSRTTAIEAGKPYVILTAKENFDAMDGFTIDNVTIDTDLQPVEIDGLRMVPVLDGGGRIQNADQYYIWENALYCAGTYPQDMPGLRAYFTSSSPLSMRARVVFNENTATSLPVIGDTENGVRKIMKDGHIIIIRGEEQYNLQGQRID